MQENGEERWQTKITSLRQGISQLYINKEFFDVQFLVQGQHYFKAHKLVLSARSSKFARELLSPNSPELIIVDDETITKDGFEILLQFIYTDHLDTSDKRKLIEGYLAALCYEQKALQYKCEEIMESWDISTDEVCNLFELGTHLPLLRNKCIQFMKNNGALVIASQSFSHTNINSLCEMLKCGAFGGVPVLQRIDAIMTWFANQHQESPIDYADIRNTLQTCSDIPLLSKLQFELLTLDELAEIIDKYDGLITPEENSKFMRYLRNKNASILPNWCIVEPPQQQQ